MKIMIGFSTDRHSTISKIIRWIQGSEYSHTFFMLPDEPFFGPVVMQADTGGVEITTYSRFNFAPPGSDVGNVLVKSYEPKLDLGPALRIAADLLNDGYGFAALLGMTWVEFWWHLFKKRVKNPFHFRNQYVCCAFVLYVLQIAKVPHADELDPNSIDDKMLADFIDENLF